MRGAFQLNVKLTLFPPFLVNRLEALKTMAASRQTRLRSDKYNANITKRGKVAAEVAEVSPIPCKLPERTALLVHRPNALGLNGPGCFLLHFHCRELFTSIWAYPCAMGLLLPFHPCSPLTDCIFSQKKNDTKPMVSPVLIGFLFFVLVGR